MVNDIHCPGDIETLNTVELLVLISNHYACTCTCIVIARIHTCSSAKSNNYTVHTHYNNVLTVFYKRHYAQDTPILGKDLQQECIHTYIVQLLLALQDSHSIFTQNCTWCSTSIVIG